MNIGRGYVDGDNIIFSSLAKDMNPFGKSKLAAFNTVTQEIVWQHTSMYQTQTHRARRPYFCGG